MLLTIVLIVSAYLVVTLWAVDKGTAIYGFFKLLPIGIFAFILSIYGREDREELLEVVPYAATVNGALAYGLSFIPALSEYFLVADRLGGFFQSPNAFAIYCLAGIIILLTAKKIGIKQLLFTALLVVLIFLSGSRTVFLFLIATAVILILKIKSKKIKLTIAGIIVLMIVAGGVVVAVTGSYQTVGRFLTISLESSTFLGRILYYIDAIPQILKHPFGLGYYGYYFTQGSFQTGVYSVAFVHNSLLQFCLDIGIVPAIVFSAAVVASFFSKNAGFRQRLLIFAVFCHSLVDFDLEFIAVFLVLLLVLDFDLFKKKSFNCNGYAVAAISVVLVVFSVYFGIINTLYLTGEYKAVNKIYGNDTMSKMQLIVGETDKTALSKYADGIIENNGCLAIAYDVKANSAYEGGDFKSVIDYKRKAIKYAPYSIEEYDDFCEKLIVGISLYSEIKDTKSVDVCKRELLRIEKYLAEVEEKTNPIAWKIQDKPQLELSEDYREIIEEYKYSEEY